MSLSQWGRVKEGATQPVASFRITAADHLPNSDAHVVVMLTDGRLVAFHLARSLSHAAGGLQVTELAQSSDFHWKIALWNERGERNG